MTCENAMLITLALLVIGGLIAFALYSATRGEENVVVGSGNAFDAYYGKDRWDPGQSLPCDECVSLGCIGAGECRCYCHRAHPRKKKK
jgi:hypothetical protein